MLFRSVDLGVDAPNTVARYITAGVTINAVENPRHRRSNRVGATHIAGAVSGLYTEATRVRNQTTSERWANTITAGAAVTNWGLETGNTEVTNARRVVADGTVRKYTCAYGQQANAVTTLGEVSVACYKRNSGKQAWAVTIDQAVLGTDVVICNNLFIANIGANPSADGCFDGHRQYVTAIVDDTFSGTQVPINLNLKDGAVRDF